MTNIPEKENLIRYPSFPDSGSASSPMMCEIESLRSLAALGPATLFTGSGTVRSEGRQEIFNKIAYFEELERKVMELHARGMNI
jgi:hypothetical protein